jgi:alkylhydroperoxidase/carboxymuconolactone decarboxylase family protein YurZ
VLCWNRPPLAKVGFGKANSDMRPPALGEVREMPELRRRYFNSRKSYAAYFDETHATGALDAKTKELMHLALVLALHCEP